jgi:hypothetical protein
MAIEPNMNALTGTPSQIEWAEQIRPRVNAEFDRVARAFEVTASKQPEAAQASTRAVIAIVEAHRTAVMAHSEAGYFIRDWRELNDQVQKLILHDPKYHAIKAARLKKGIA